MSLLQQRRRELHDKVGCRLFGHDDAEAVSAGDDIAVEGNASVRVGVEHYCALSAGLGENFRRQTGQQEDSECMREPHRGFCYLTDGSARRRLVRRRKEKVDVEGLRGMFMFGERGRRGKKG